MYFNNNKSNTNIDDEFKNNKKINIDFKGFNLKPILLVGGGIVLLLIIIFIIMSLINKSSKYTIKLLGEPSITIGLGDDYIEPGYEAYDKNNNNITNKVEITSNLDIYKTGDYEILYSIEGVTQVRYVKVIEKGKTIHIQLLGDTTMYLKVGEKYKEPGYNVYDSVDKNLKDKVIVTGTVDTSKKGTYKITYSVTNSRNSTDTKVRYVVVE